MADGNEAANHLFAEKRMGKIAGVLEKMGKCDSTTKQSGFTVVHENCRKASAAALYPPDFCRAILLGAEDQRRAEGHLIPAYIGKLLE